MSFAPDTIIAGRYQLLESLGAGAMGEVWKAQDTRFEDRLVALKLLKEDETLKEDARNRNRFARTVQDEATSGGLTRRLLINTLDDILMVGGNAAQLRERVEKKLGDKEECAVDEALRLFDELVGDPVFNENARVRAKIRKLFRDEANSVANLRHDNIVAIFDYGDHEGLPFLVMDYIEGRTLYRAIQRGEIMSRSRQLRLMEDLCSGLAHAHKKNLVHRDIKPANLIIDSSTDRLKILDFGVVRRLQNSGESTVGVPIGTFCYMSPEQTRGSASLDHRSDIFAVGAVMYEFLTGKKAFPPAGTVSDLIARIHKEQPTPLKELIPDIEAGIEPIVAMALEKNPDRRYQGLQAMERDIARVRARLERESEIADRTVVFDRGDQTVVVDGRPAQKMQGLLQSARAAYATGDDHAVIEFCQEVLKLDATHAEAPKLMQQAVERLDRMQIEPIAREVQVSLDKGEITSAGHLLKKAKGIAPKSPRVAQLSELLESARVERELAQMSAKRINELIAAATEHLEYREFDQAREAAQAILNLDATNAGAQQLLNRIEQAIAQAEAEREVQRIATDALNEADAQALRGELDGAIAHLRQVAQPTREVELRIEELVEARDAVRKQAAIDAALDDARVAASAGDHDGVLVATARALELDPDHDEAAALAQTARLELATLEHLSAANALVREQKLADAIAYLDSRRATHAVLAKRWADLVAERDRIEQQRLEQERAAAEAARVKAEAAAEAARLQALEEEKARLAAAEAARLKALEEENARLAAIEAARLKAIEEENARLAAIEAARLKAIEEENARIAAEAKAAEEKQLKAKAAKEAEERKAREAEEARLKAEKEAADRHAREVAAQVAAVTADFKKGKLTEAAKAIDKLAIDEPALEDIPRLRTELARLQKEQFDKRAQDALSKAKGLEKAEKFDEAIALLRAFTPAHEAIPAEISRLEIAAKELVALRAKQAEEARIRAEREAEEARVRAEKEAAERHAREIAARVAAITADFKKAKFAEAAAAIEKLAADEPALADIPRLKTELAQAERAHFDRRAQDAITEAKQLESKEKFDEAIALLKGFKPVHDTIAPEITRLEKAAKDYRERKAREAKEAEEARQKAEAERIAREEARKKQLAAEAAAKEKERQEQERKLKAVLASARSALAKGELAAAFDQAAQARTIDAESAEVTRLESELLVGLREAFAKAPSDSTLIALRQQHDPAYRKQKTMTMAGMVAAAVLVLAVSGYLLVAKPWSRGATEATVAQNQQQQQQPPPAIQPPVATQPDPIPSTGPPVVPSPPAIDPTPPPETAAAAGFTTVSVNLLPWARVSIKASDPNAKVPTEAQMTPFSIDLPPGQYTLEVLNGVTQAREQIPLTVKPGVPTQQVQRALRGFNPDTVVNTLMNGQNR